MRDRLFKNWTFIRVLYLALGGFILFQAIVEHKWLETIIGGYIASMGLFAFGCASGNCFNVNSIQPHRNTGETLDVEFEEIK